MMDAPELLYINGPHACFTRPRISLPFHVDRSIISHKQKKKEKGFLSRPVLFVTLVTCCPRTACNNGTSARYLGPCSLSLSLFEKREKQTWKCFIMRLALDFFFLSWSLKFLLDQSELYTRCSDEDE